MKRAYKKPKLAGAAPSQKEESAVSFQAMSGDSLVQRIRRHLDELAIEKAKLELRQAAEPVKGSKSSLPEDEAARILGVTPRTIRSYVKHGKLRRLTKNGRIACDAKWQKMCTERVRSIWKRPHI